MKRGIINNSTPLAQFAKLVSEIGELGDNIAKTRDITDDIGDCLVILINIAKREGTTLEECLPPPPECDTIYVTEYITIIDTIIQYQDVFITEYIDCQTGLPCDITLQELVNESKNTGLLYNLSGKVIRKPEGVYIENGQIKYKL